MRYHKSANRATLSPQEALDFLIEGNYRFLNNLRVNRNLLEIVNDTKDGQTPFVSILSCSDSRVPVELIFDQGLGDIFSVRLAGNVAGRYAIGSLEFACKALNTRLIVVLGHTGCGAIKGACDSVTAGNISHIINLIKPAVEAETETQNAAERNSKNPTFLSNVTYLNVAAQIKIILDNSPLIKEMLEKKEIGIVGGIYNLSTGGVTFFEEDKIFDLKLASHTVNPHLLYE